MRLQNPEEKTQQQERTSRNKIKIFEFRLRLPITPLYKMLAVRFRTTLRPKRIGECSEPGSIDSTRTDRS
jgi:hypothetical protein